MKDARLSGAEFLAVLGRNSSGKSTPPNFQRPVHPPKARDRSYGYARRKRVWTSASRWCLKPDNQLAATVVEEDVRFGAKPGVKPRDIRPRVMLPPCM